MVYRFTPFMPTLLQIVSLLCGKEIIPRSTIREILLQSSRDSYTQTPGEAIRFSLLYVDVVLTRGKYRPNAYLVAPIDPFTMGALCCQYEGEYVITGHSLTPTKDEKGLASVRDMLQQFFYQGIDNPPPLHQCFHLANENRVTLPTRSAIDRFKMGELDFRQIGCSHYLHLGDKSFALFGILDTDVLSLNFSMTFLKAWVFLWRFSFMTP
ncbi:hypothetical protein BJX99DRAFT_226138 [Aspergillus californicus]